MKVLSTGIDTLNLAAIGVVRPEVWGLLEDAQQRAKRDEESQLLNRFTAVSFRIEQVIFWRGLLLTLPMGISELRKLRG